MQAYLGTPGSHHNKTQIKHGSSAAIAHTTCGTNRRTLYPSLVCPTEAWPEGFAPDATVPVGTGDPVESTTDVVFKENARM